LKISEASHGETSILLALHEHVHVLLAGLNVVGAGLETVEERLVEAHAWVLLLSNLLSGLLINGLSILNWLLLDRCLLLLLRSISMAAAASHDTSDGLVSNLRTSTHGHTSGESTAKTATADAKTATDLGSSGSWGVMVMMNLLRRRLLMMHCGSGRSSRSSGTETRRAT
jgi:hypothetical protein